MLNFASFFLVSNIQTKEAGRKGEFLGSQEGRRVGMEVDALFDTEVRCHEKKLHPCAPRFCDQMACSIMIALPRLRVGRFLHRGRTRSYDLSTKIDEIINIHSVSEIFIMCLVSGAASRAVVTSRRLFGHHD